MAHILLVEDNELNRDMLGRRLRRRGHDVAIAVDGAEAIAAVTTNPPDLILMDMSLPVMDGWEATKTLKADSRTSHIPIIALTAHAMAGEREKAIGVGCDDYDTKPVEIRRLLKKMEVFLGQGNTTAARTTDSNSTSAPSVILSNPAANSAASTPRYDSADPASIRPAVAVPKTGPVRVDGLGTLLVVDDNANNRDMLKRRLARKGHTVIAVESGEAALDCLNANSPNYHLIDMVLLDVMMPGMDGIEALQRIRQSYSQLQLPVIMITAKDSNQDMLRAFDLGANDYITKPIDFDVAIARIQNQLFTVQAVRRQAAQQAPSLPTVPFPLPRSNKKSSLESHTTETWEQTTKPIITEVSGTTGTTQPPPVIPAAPSFPPLPASFRPVAAMPSDRLNGRYEVLQVLAKDTFSQLLLVKDMGPKDRQKTGQSLYFLKKINLARFPLGVSRSSSKQQVIDFLHSDMPRLKDASRHAYISTLVDSFIQDDAFFTVQDFVEGELFANVWQNHGPLSFTQAVPLFKELFGAVDFIHQHRVAHGEIHAHHLVRRQADDRLVLIDLGLTQRVLHYLTPNSVTEIDFVQGYMPPEQCEGKLLFSSDVYALGMLMLQALTGKNPEYINRDVVTGELKWRELTDLDDKTARVIKKIVSQNYAERYAYPEQAAKDLLFQWYTLRFKRTLS